MPRAKKTTQEPLRAPEQESATSFSFGAAMEEIETLLETVEQGTDVALEQTIAHVERGMELIKTCQAHLQTMQNKIEKITATPDA